MTSGYFQGPRYQHLVAAVGRAIAEADAIRLLEIGAPADEYAPEIGTILRTVSSVFIAGSGQSSRLHVEVSSRLDTMIEKGFRIEAPPR